MKPTMGSLSLLVPLVALCCSLQLLASFALPLSTNGDVIFRSGSRSMGKGLQASAAGAEGISSSSSTSRRRRLVFSLFGSKSQLKDFEPCDMDKMDYTPCEDQERAKKYPKEGLVHRERHCPAPEEELNCLIPPPVGYKYPLPWPQSRDEAWYVNVPHKHLTKMKADQNWIRYNEQTEKFIFPGGGTMFHHGADAYIEELGQLIPLTDGSIRTALDTGCGVGSFGAYMFSRQITTMSIAPRDGHEAQVQFALERGLPAMLGVLASKRLPFPARAFDLAHCSRCLIPWWIEDGRLLAEVDRVLRPGGFWVLTGPPIDWKKYASGWARTEEDLKEEQDKLEATAASLCWTKFVEQGMFAVWQKPLDGSCVKNRDESVRPPICPADQNPDFAWYTTMETCISRVPESDSEGVAGGKLPSWPSRISAVPPRVSRGSIPGVTEQSFEEENALWKGLVTFYKDKALPEIAEFKYRNVMDMNAGLGAFAAALVDDPLWVMNVVPVDRGVDTLGAIYERGLLGVYHNWCEAFSTYPRTYDLIHASGLFTDWDEKSKCSLQKVLLEMDRILRPEGAVIIRDQTTDLKAIHDIAAALRWDARLEPAPEGDKYEQVLVCVKKYWTAG